MKLLFGLVKLWESHKRVDITKLCNMISEMNESVYFSLNQFMYSNIKSFVVESLILNLVYFFEIMI